MGRGFASLTTIIALQIIASKILPSNAQPTLSQFLQLAGFGPLAAPLPPVSPLPAASPPINYPSSSYATSPAHQSSSYQNTNYQNTIRSNPPQSNPLPLAAIANLAASVSTPQVPPEKAPVVPKASETLPSAGLDSNVLNNLAIALQLLIVSNILNMPPAEIPDPISNLDLPKLDVMPAYEHLPISSLSLSYPVQSTAAQPSFSYLETSRPQNLYYESEIPAANFLGSSGFAEPPIFRSAVQAKPNPRSSMTLMSPYEALGPSSPFSDPILSTVYSPSYSKKEFQSPYASILAADGHRDLFSFADFF